MSEPKDDDKEVEEVEEEDENDDDLGAECAIFRCILGGGA
jgi:hypothetical protein